MKKKISELKIELKEKKRNFKIAKDQFNKKSDYKTSEQYRLAKAYLHGTFMKLSTAYKRSDNIKEALNILYFLRDEFDNKYDFDGGSGLADKIAYYESLDQNYLESLKIHKNRLEDCFKNLKEDKEINAVEFWGIKKITGQIANICKKFDSIKSEKILDIGHKSFIIALASSGRLLSSDYADELERTLKSKNIKNFYTSQLDDLVTLNDEANFLMNEFDSSSDFFDEYYESTRYLNSFRIYSTFTISIEKDVLDKLRIIIHLVKTGEDLTTENSDQKPDKTKLKDDDKEYKKLANFAPEITNIEFKKVVELANEGFSIEKIINKTGYKRVKVSKILRILFFQEFNDVQITRKNIELSQILLDKKIDFNKEKIIDLVNSGHNKNQIRKILDFKDKTNVEKAIKKLFFNNELSLTPAESAARVNDLLREKSDKKRQDLWKIKRDNAPKVFFNNHKDIMIMRNEGKTLEEIGKVKGVTRERIRQIQARIIGSGPYEGFEILTKEEIKVIKNKINANKVLEQIKILKDQNEEFLIKYYNENRSLKSISEEINITVDKISQCLELLKQEGKISYFRKTGHEKVNEEERQIVYQTIKDMREKGKNLQTIAETLGYSPPWVSNTIRDMRDQGIYVADNHRMSNREYLRDWDKIETRSKEILDLIKLGAKSYSAIDKDLGFAEGYTSRHVKRYLKDEVEEILRNQKKDS